MATNAFAAGAYAAAQGLSGLGGVAKPSLGAKPGGLSDFSSLLQNALGGAAEAGAKAEKQALAAVSGKGDLVIAAYEDIMSMPI